jgi:hypothetical protein
MEAGNPSLLMFGEGNIVNMRVANEQVALKFHRTQRIPYRSQNSSLSITPNCNRRGFWTGIFLDLRVGQD